MIAQRVLYVLATGERGGMETNLIAEVRHLDRNRFTPLVACLEDGPVARELQAAGATTHALGRGRLRHALVTIRTIARLRRLIDAESVDLVVSQNALAHCYGRVASALAGIPCVLRIGGVGRPPDLPERIAYRLGAPTVIANSAFTKAQLIAAGVAADRIVIVYRGVLPAGSGFNRDHVRAQFQWRANNIVVAVAGRLQKGKGQHVLLAAAPQVLRRHPQTRFLIVGGPLFGLEPGYERELKVQARDAGLDGRVVFTGFRADVPALLAASDVIVVPSITPEGFGMATLEGMAAGRPVVATGIGATPELITDDVSGMLVPPNDPEKLAEVLMRLIDNQQHRERLGTCARRTALERFSLPPVVRAYEDVYSSAIQRRSTGASRHNREAPSSLRGERIVDEVHDAHYYRHLRRYLFARQYTAGCRAVLDAGCGSGYGTRLLAEDAEQVIGCDYDPDAVAYSSDHFRKPNLRFAVADSRALAFRSAMFDTVVSLEVFEHVVEWQQFLTEARRVLKPEGIFVLSTPNRLTTRLQEKKTGQRHYEYHVGEVTPKELESRLRGFFRHVEVFAMRRNGNALYAWLRRMDVLNLRFKLPQRMRHQLSRDMGVSWDPRGVVSPDDFVIEKSQWRQALSIVAVCRL